MGADVAEVARIVCNTRLCYIRDMIEAGGARGVRCTPRPHVTLN